MLKITSNNCDVKTKLNNAQEMTWNGAQFTWLLLIWRIMPINNQLYITHLFHNIISFKKSLRESFLK